MKPNELRGTENMQEWEIIWHSGRKETVQAKNYTEAHRKAHNRANWVELGPVFKIGLVA
jgi:hypothetical protein